MRQSLHSLCNEDRAVPNVEVWKWQTFVARDYISRLSILDIAFSGPLDFPGCSETLIYSDSVSKITAESFYFRPLTSRRTVFAQNVDRIQLANVYYSRLSVDISFCLTANSCFLLKWVFCCLEKGTSYKRKRFARNRTRTILLIK